MTKREELEALAHGEGCLARSQDSEPIFILVARDRLAADKVRSWAADLAIHNGPKYKVADAYAIADDMDRWRDLHGGGKLPD
jgi:hypothetical protein